jgi:hypothetical protein|tara:strand:- start:12559 stop:15147 length:2589 start_codon:yes stop_codon:yes gene_type:complete
MAKEIINDGIIPNDGQGDNLRLGAQKINSNFDELYNALGNGDTLSTISSNTVTALGGNKITFYFATEGDLPNATTYDGMFAHVHADNTSRVAHSGTWVKLIQETSSIDMLSDVETSSPAPGDGQALVWSDANSRWQAGSIDAGASTFVSLTDTPASLASHNNKFVAVNSTANAIEFSTPSIDRMLDVDVTTTPPTAGQVLKWNGTNWIPGIDATSGGAGSDADTLDGLDSTYFLNYNNITNKGQNFSKSFSVSAATYTPTTGVMELTIGAHNLIIGNKIKIAPNSLGFSCSFDNNVATSTYPRASGSAAPGGEDYFYNKPIEITAVSATTITVNVGTGNVTSYNVSNAVYTPATGNMVLTVGTHTLVAGNYIDIATGGLTFSCALDGHVTNTAYPRASGSAAPGGYDYFYNTPCQITSVGATTITMNVGISSNTSTHTFVSAINGAITNSNSHTFVSASADCVTFSQTFVDLSDTPSDYSGAADRFVKVNNAGDGIVFAVGTSGDSNLSELSDVTTIGDYYNVSNAVYTPASGVIVLTIGLHSLQVGHNIKIASNSLTFTCAMDSNATEHTYPRGSGSAYAGGKDPAYTSTSAITAVGTDSITVNVGISSNTTAHTFVRASDNCISVTEKTYSTSAATYTPTTGVMQLTIGTHAIKSGHSVMIAANSLTFTCAMDSHNTQHTYPRASGGNAPGGEDYVYNKPALVTETSSTTITVNVGVSSNITAHTFISANANNVKVAPTHGDSLYFNGVSWVKQNGPISRYEITNDGNNNYVWEGPGFTTGTNDPVMYMNRGHTYVLNNNSGGSHAFEIRVSNGGSAYTSGVTGDKTNTQVFRVPMDAPSTLYYQCTSHTAMGNTINIVS